MTLHSTSKHPTRRCYWTINNIHYICNRFQSFKIGFHLFINYKNLSHKQWHILAHIVPVAAVWKFGYHHPASPGLQVSLSGHLAARSVLVHLSYALHLSTAAKTHIRGWLHICSVVHGHWSEKYSLSANTLSLFWIFWEILRSTKTNPVQQWWCTDTSSRCAWCWSQHRALGLGWPFGYCSRLRLVLSVLLLLKLSDGLIQKAAASDCNLLGFCSLLADDLLYHLTITWRCDTCQTPSSLICLAVNTVQMVLNRDNKTVKMGLWHLKVYNLPLR